MDKRLSRLMVCAYEEEALARNRGFVEMEKRAAELAAEGRLEELREIIRRLLWSMNDESGGVGWYAAEAAAAVLAGAPELIREYGIILASHMKEYPFEVSVHRALARLVPLAPALFAGAGVGEELAVSLSHGVPAVRAAAARCLAALDLEKYRPAVIALSNDDSPVIEYDCKSDTMREKTVAGMIGEITKH